MGFAVGMKCNDDLMIKKIGKKSESFFHDPETAASVHLMLLKECLGIFERCGIFKGWTSTTENFIVSDVITYSHFDDNEYQLTVYTKLIE